MTIRGEISHRDVAPKITFFQSLARFICLKGLLLRILDANIANYYSKPFHFSETFFVESIRCKHCQIMQYPIFELRSRIAPIKSRGRPAEIFAHLKTRIL